MNSIQTGRMLHASLEAIFCPLKKTYTLTYVIPVNPAGVCAPRSLIESLSSILWRNIIGTFMSTLYVIMI
jgi:hypothetical protein